MYIPGQALRVPGGWGSQNSRQPAHEGGMVVSPKHRPPLPRRNYSWYSFLLEAESSPRFTVRPVGLCQGKIPVTPSGIEPATFRLVVRCLNQLPHRVPVHTNIFKFTLEWIFYFNLGHCYIYLIKHGHLVQYLVMTTCIDRKILK